VSLPRDPVTIVGAGPAGTLAALLLARRGLQVSVYDRRPDPRVQPEEGGRSINLALAARGINALEHADVMERVRSLLIPLRGRMLHEVSGHTVLIPYGQYEHEVIYSFSRAQFNRALIEAAAQSPQIRFHFEQTCVGADPAADVLHFRESGGTSAHARKLTPCIAADGAGSAVRASLATAGYLSTREELLDHDYRELSIAAQGGEFVLEPHALHVWPRGGFMLIALPNTDGSFTATLFLPRAGATSFAALTDDAAVQQFFAREFPDVVPLMHGLAQQFRDHPQGRLGTVYADTWHVGGQVQLLGDAAHAIVPFHGQGMNAALEDCVVLDALLDRADSWGAVFAQFSRLRAPDAAAIARMAIENYLEMRDTVRDPKFVRQKAQSLALERCFPEHFIPRYSMVMFHPEIAYAEAERRGAVQAQILEELDTSAQHAGETGIDFRRAEGLIRERLKPLR
jgi:kynurenine 3-monooxygenase